MSETTKFVYITWAGKGVSFAKRGKYGVVSGSIEKHFSVSNLIERGERFRSYKAMQLQNFLIQLSYFILVMPLPTL